MNHFNRIKRTIANLELRWARTSPRRYVAFLRKKGVIIGENNWIHPKLKTISIDVSRPSLVQIGSHVRINKNFTLLTHDFSSYVFKEAYNDFVSSSGKVVIGNNVYFGRDCTVLKGVTIGDNTIIGYGSLVTKSIPPNSVAVGRPAKVISSLEDYYQKRKKVSIQEAIEYAQSIYERYHRNPTPEDFWEEFPLFVDRENINDYPGIPIRKRLGDKYNVWIKTHSRLYKSFEDFMKECGL